MRIKAKPKIKCHLCGKLVKDRGPNGRRIYCGFKCQAEANRRKTNERAKAARVARDLALLRRYRAKGERRVTHG